MIQHYAFKTQKLVRLPLRVVTVTLMNIFELLLNTPYYIITAILAIYCENYINGRLSLIEKFVTIYRKASIVDISSPIVNT